MQFGIVTGLALPSTRALDSASALEFEMELCRVTHDHGFDIATVANRYLAGPDVQFFSPLLLVARIMTLYPGLRVGTSVLLVPYLNPVEVAEQIATLDRFSPGRLLLGVGQGYKENEAVAFGIEHGERGRRMTEHIKALRMLWEDGPSTLDGEFWRFEDADIGVRPTNGVPPILVAADAARTVELIPERGGDHWFPSSRCTKTFLREAMPRYRDALERSGRMFEGLPLIRDICVAGTRREAESLIEESFTNYLHLQHSHGQPGERYDVDFDQLKHDRLILGTSEDAVTEILALKREFDTDIIVFRVYTPGMDTERALEVVRQLGDEVLPAVRREVGTASIFDQ